MQMVRIFGLPFFLPNDFSWRKNILNLTEIGGVQLHWASFYHINLAIHQYLFFLHNSSQSSLNNIDHFHMSHFFVMPKTFFITEFI